MAKSIRRFGASGLLAYTLTLGGLPALLLTAACKEAAEPWGGSVDDSAGVTLVTNPSTGLWAPGDAWTVEEELSIGIAGGDASYEFGSIVGVDVDDQGTIYVADVLAHQIRVFGPDGTYFRTIGSGGSGPEQLGTPFAGPFLAEGTVRVADLGNQRVSRFSPDGALLASFRLDFASGIPMRWDEVAGDVLVAQVRAIGPAGPTGTLRGGPVVSFADDGAVGDTVLDLPPGESIQMGGDQFQIRLFASEPMWDASDDGRLVSGRNSDYRIEIRGQDGELRQVVSRPFERRPVTERDQQVIKNALAEAAQLQGTPPEAIEILLQRMSFADTYPTYASLLAGPVGSIWVQRIRTGTDLAGDEGGFDVQDLGSNEWDVFDRDGRYLGVVEFPGRFQPLRVVADRFYGVARDELDIQTLAVYRLVR